MLISKRVQGKKILKEHLVQCYCQKRSITEKLESINFKLLDIKTAKADKVLNVLDYINATTSCLAQDEGIFMR